jgi:nucleoside-diphosphate-sugar epimerase
MIFILGGRGFLGSALARYCARRGWDHAAIDQDNYASWAGRSCDLLVNASGNSRKFLANDSPVEDFDQNVRSVRRILEDFRYGMFAQFSSADVYPDSSSESVTSETQPIDPARQTRYGFHKHVAELCVRHRAPKWVILRLSGFVGPGLRKNAVYDVVHGNVLWVDPESEFQYLHVYELARLIFEIAARNELAGEVVNVASRGVVSVREVAAWAGKPVCCRPGSPRVRCELNISKLLGHCGTPETAAGVRAYLAEIAEESPGSGQ